ncbi:MAG: NBR1-Ig-like domain-containing protein [Anaerolineaceae bacterium]|nr:NBR1-Ig-like domain-containing protein [Anaerolineaceae bacterium]
MPKSFVNRRACLSFLSIFIIILITSACNLSSIHTAPDSDESQFFIPPTIAPTEEPTPPSTSVPTSSVVDENSSDPAEEENVETDSTARDCQDSLVFISDITIPDGTKVVAGSTLDKQWEIENNGTCNWNEGYSIHLISGPELGADSEQSLAPARSGSRTTIRVEFTAPEQPGSYQSIWQAYNPEEEPFGDTFYIEVIVE